MADELNHSSNRTHQEQCQPSHKRHDNRWMSIYAALLAIPIILACGARPVTINTAPARDLMLDITIHGQDAGTEQVTVEVRAHLAHQPPPYVFSSSHTLTCNGIAIPGITGIAQVPRQPPGGAYTFIYTDEQGQRTTLAIPVPLGRFALTSPVEGAQIKLPQLPSFAATPTITASTPGTGNAGSTSVVWTPQTPTPLWPVRDPSQTSQPPVLIHYSMPSYPAGATGTFQVTADCGGDGRPLCGTIAGPSLDATGTYGLTDAGVGLGGGFEVFTPGTGDLAVSFMMGWPAAPGGFNAVHVAFSEQRVLHITWAR